VTERSQRKVWTLTLVPGRDGCDWAIRWRVDDPRSRRTGEVHRVTVGRLLYTTAGDHPADLITDLERIVHELRRRYLEGSPLPKAVREPRGAMGGDVALPGMEYVTDKRVHRLDQGLPY
jgi:hypothetical protein